MQVGRAAGGPRVEEFQGFTCRVPHPHTRSHAQTLTKRQAADRLATSTSCSRHPGPFRPDGPIGCCRSVSGASLVDSMQLPVCRQDNAWGGTLRPALSHQFTRSLFQPPLSGKGGRICGVVINLLPGGSSIGPSSPIVSRGSMIVYKLINVDDILNIEPGWAYGGINH